MVQATAPTVKLKGFFWSKIPRPAPESVWATLQPPAALLTEQQLAALEGLFPQMMATPVVQTAQKGQAPMLHQRVGGWGGRGAMLKLPAQPAARAAEGMRGRASLCRAEPVSACPGTHPQGGRSTRLILHHLLMLQRTLTEVQHSCIGLHGGWERREL